MKMVRAWWRWLVFVFGAKWVAFKFWFMSPELRSVYRDLQNGSDPCATGRHSFSWREAGQSCRYCGEPPKGDDYEQN